MNNKQENSYGKDSPTGTFVATFDFQFVNHKFEANYMMACVDGQNQALANGRPNAIG